MKTETAEKIRVILKNSVDATLHRIKKKKSFRPFHEALLSKAIVNAAAFERSFSTSFGQGAVEEIAALVAVDAGYEVERQKVTFVNVYKGALDEIRRNLNALREGEKKPNWKREIERLSAFNKGDTEVIRVISDLYLKGETRKIFISIKTVKPNLDQTEIAKKDMLLLKAHNPDYQTYFGLFYNPGGEERKDYNWMIPFKLFDMHHDECVLIGKDFWNTIGGENTYSRVYL